MADDINNSNQTVSNLLNIESLINSYNARLETIEKDSEQYRDMVNALLENDDEYQKQSEEAKKIGKLKTQAKSKVLQSPEAKNAVEKLKEYQMQVKEAKVALSDYLSQYVTLAGTNQIEGPDGILRKIIYTAKLVKSAQN
jgi:hypothetical protein